jgi:hypothetical protein
MSKRTLLLCAFIVGLPAFAIPAELEGDYLYKVTTVRAAAGALENLLAWEDRMTASGYYREAGSERPLLMRHSQGDQWDLLVITPMESWSAYHAPEATERRRKAAAEHAELIAEGQAMFAFYEDHFAFGPSWSAIAAAYADNNFYHIEMFMAAPGKAAALLEQRRMENAYLSATGQVPNMIFRRAAGSDVDVFTIGFHPSFEAFAAPAGVTDEEKDRAAKDAGFKGLADLSFYLRSLISAHRDTLAVKVD